MNMKSITYMRRGQPQQSRQRGAALVVALILLVALSLMAISSMNTASLDLIMAGNEQFRSRSFVAAEAGIEYAMDYAPLNSNSDYTQSATAVGSGSDSFTYTLTRPNGGEPEPVVGDSSMNEGSGFSRISFRITSDGKSERGTASRHIQELYREIRKPDSASAADECGAAAAANLDGTTSTC